MKQRRDFSFFKSSCHLPTCQPHSVQASHCSFSIAERQAGKLWLASFFSLWSYPTGNRTRGYRFSSRRSVRLTTDHKLYPSFQLSTQNLRQCLVLDNLSKRIFSFLTTFRTVYCSHNNRDKTIKRCKLIILL